jgi:hypothetical protein
MMSPVVSKKIQRDHAAGRRTFFRSFLGDVAVFFDELRGKPQLRLMDLSNLPDHVLSQIKPVISDGTEISLVDGYVAARRKASEKSRNVLELNPENLFVFNRFNGATTIDDIADGLSRAMSWDRQQAFDYTRSVFLRLAQFGTCVPGNPIDSDLQP